MMWRCSACGAINGGLSKRCGERIFKGGRIVLGTSGGCGKSLEHEEWFAPDDISSNAALTNAEDISKALAGPDWRCCYCGSSQRRGDGECANCGGEEKPLQERATIPSVTPPSSYTPPVRTHKHPYRESFPSDPPRESFPNFRVSRSWLPFAIGGGVLALIAIVTMLLWPRSVDAAVTAVQWQSTVTVERYKIRGEEGWYPPGDAIDTENRGQRIHHYDHVKVGTEQVSRLESYACGQTCITLPRTCSTTPRSCSSNGNGTMSCSGGDTVCSGGGESCSTKYCSRTVYDTVPVYEDQPRYQTWYVWRAWRWGYDRTIHRSGTDLKPLPPETAKIRLNASCVGEERERFEISWAYKTTFMDAKGKAYSYVPKTEKEFQQLPTGTKKRLLISITGVSIKDDK